ncbi:hypothetical protein PMI04_009660 [Sphingobium sp. AP49]|uniref:hypothetical protein n=1 Tax=Sphingobium sp. AP49 TaxID=1144307 RepID=UPI00026EC821|nr:hypothetical protein [Sphingobium sp. AP49]WHO40826.1 hypothetical protein PMI04_009660 [Sphingobium sp. AP49]
MISKLEVDIAIARVTATGQTPVRIYLNSHDLLADFDEYPFTGYSGIPVTFADLGMPSRVVGHQGYSWKISRVTHD